MRCILRSNPDGTPRAKEYGVTLHGSTNPERRGLLLYQHDDREVFRFVLVGSLEGSWVDELQHAWTTAASVIAGKELVVSIEALVDADEAGIRLLWRMREAGARILPPTSRDVPETLLAFGTPPASPIRPAAGGFWRGLAARMVPMSRQLP